MKYHWKDISLYNILIKSYIMKYFIYVSLLGLISSSIFLSSDNYKKEEQNNSKRILQLDDYICCEGQWIYLHGCVGYPEMKLQFSILHIQKKDSIQLNYRHDKFLPHKLSTVKVSDSCIYIFTTRNLEGQNIKSKEFHKKVVNETLVRHSVCINLRILAT